MDCDLCSQYIQVRKLFKGGNYSRAKTIRGNTVCPLLQTPFFLPSQRNFPISFKPKVAIAEFFWKMQKKNTWYSILRVDAMPLSLKNLFVIRTVHIMGKTDSVRQSKSRDSTGNSKPPITNVVDLDNLCNCQICFHQLWMESCMGQLLLCLVQSLCKPTQLLEKKWNHTIFLGFFYEN